ncbi:MAG: hypothetical protein ACPGQL_08995 [Thermoplasmatota archaeon]
MATGRPAGRQVGQTASLDAPLAGWILGVATFLPLPWILQGVPAPWTDRAPMGFGNAVAVSLLLLEAMLVHHRFYAYRYEADPKRVLRTEAIGRLAVLAFGALVVAAHGAAWERYLLVAVPVAAVNWRVHSVLVRALTGYRTDITLAAWGTLLTLYAVAGRLGLGHW